MTQQFKRITGPVDVSDAEQFPEIALALAHAAKLKAQDSAPVAQRRTK